MCAVAKSVISDEQGIDRPSGLVQNPLERIDVFSKEPTREKYVPRAVLVYHGLDSDLPL